MLDVFLRGVSFRYDSGFALESIDLTFPKSTHTAVIGPPRCGASTLLRLIAGAVRLRSGEIVIGARAVTTMRSAARPLLYVSGDIDVPARWSVRHALINAVRARTIDRADRVHELALAATKWELEAILDRKVSTLSATESLRVHIARIDLRRPGILVADRLFERAAAGVRTQLADELYRLLRVVGTTVISAPSSIAELGTTDAVAVLDEGRVVQSGTAAQVFASPATEGAARATGDVNAIPVRVTGSSVESVIGNWTAAAPAFEGDGVALARPGDFVVAAAGEESDLIFGIEEAWFDDGGWTVRGLLTGGLELRVRLPREAAIRKGRLLALRFDPTRFTLLPRAVRQSEFPVNAIPLMRDSR